MKEASLMRIKKIVLGIMMVAALLILARPSISNAVPYSGAWLPNSTNFLVALEVTSATGSGSFYMYDWDDGISDNLFLLNDGYYSAATIPFTYNSSSNTWFASTLNLGPSPEFGFYFLNSSGTTYTEYGLELNDTGNAYILTDTNTGMIVSVGNAAPVPIPASALLLGSGILGLITIGRVRRKDS